MNSLKKMYFSMENHISYLLISIIFSVISSISGIVLAKYMGSLINSAIDGNMELLITSAIMTVIAIISSFIFNSLSTYYNKKFAKNSVIKLKTSISSVLLYNNRVTINNLEQADLMNLYISDADTLHRDFYSLLGSVISNIIKIILSLFALYFINTKIFISFVLISSIPPFIIRLTKNKSINVYNNFSENSSIFLEKVKEFILGRNTIINNNVSGIFLKRMQKYDNAFESSRLNRDVTVNIISFFSISVGMIAHMFCMIIAAYLIFNGEIKVGAMISSTQLLNFVFPPLNAVLTQITSIKSTESIRKKYINILEIERNNEQLDFNYDDIHNIRFNNVSTYNNNKIIINNFSYNFECGKKYAIIGKSGLGKSTLLKILTKEVEYTGNVYISNGNLKDISGLSLMKNISYVEQNPFMFNDSVKNNITLFKEKYIDYDLIYKLGISEDLLNKECVGVEGSKISGGEKKRISLARSIQENSKVIIFDEPTTGLDPKSAKNINNYIFNYTNLDSLIIVITHDWNAEYLSYFDDIINLETYCLKQKEPSQLFVKGR